MSFVGDFLSSAVQTLGAVGSVAANHLGDSLVPGYDPIIGNLLTGAEGIITPTGNFTDNVWQELSDNGLPSEVGDAWQGLNGVADVISTAYAGGYGADALGVGGEVAGGNEFVDNGFGFGGETGSQTSAGLGQFGNGTPQLEGTTALKKPWETMDSGNSIFSQIRPDLNSSSGGPTSSNTNSTLDTIKSGLQLAAPIMSIGSGIYGMTQAADMKAQAAAAANRSDPWGASGGRGVSDAQLQALLSDPGQAAANDPAYKLRIQAAQRATAGYGQNSGAMAVAGANASTDWYNQRLAQLGGLAGAGVNPASGQQVAASYNTSAADLASKSLGSIGYGVTRAGGNQMPQAVRDWLLSQGVAA